MEYVRGPHAVKEVFAAYSAAAEAGRSEDILPIICALEITERYEMSPSFINKLSVAAGFGEEHVRENDAEGTPNSAENPLLRYVFDALRFYFDFHRHYDQGYSAHIHDYLAGGVAVGDRPMNLSQTGSADDVLFTSAWFGSKLQKSGVA